MGRMGHTGHMLGHPGRGNFEPMDQWLGSVQTSFIIASGKHTVQWNTTKVACRKSHVQSIRARKDSSLFKTLFKALPSVSIHSIEVGGLTQ